MDRLANRPASGNWRGLADWLAETPLTVPNGRLADRLAPGNRLAGPLAAIGDALSTNLFGLEFDLTRFLTQIRVVVREERFVGKIEKIKP